MYTSLMTMTTFCKSAAFGCKRATGQLQTTSERHHGHKLRASDRQTGRQARGGQAKTNRDRQQTKTDKQRQRQRQTGREEGSERERERKTQNKKQKRLDGLAWHPFAGSPVFGLPPVLFDRLHLIPLKASHIGNSPELGQEGVASSATKESTLTWSKPQKVTKHGTQG